MLFKIAACTKNGSAFSLQLFHLCFSSPLGRRGAEAPEEQPRTALPPGKYTSPSPAPLQMLPALPLPAPAERTEMQERRRNPFRRGHCHHVCFCRNAMYQKPVSTKTEEIRKGSLPYALFEVQTK